MANRSCLSYFKNLDKNRKKFKKDLKSGHPIYTLMSEHEVILNLLGKLKRENLKIQKMENYKKDKVFEILKNIAKHLIEAEPHHQREEEVLFPEIKRRGIFGPPEVMKEEHKILRKAKRELLNITENVSEKNFSQFKKKLNEVVNLVVPTLKDHIAKEDNILYPISFKAIKEENVWEKIKEKCDKIGYCCFTPKIKI